MFCLGVHILKAKLTKQFIPIIDVFAFISELIPMRPYNFKISKLGLFCIKIIL